MPATTLTKLVLLGALWALAVGEPHRPVPVPFCQEHTELLTQTDQQQIRDIHQEWLMLMRVETDMQLLRNNIVNPPTNVEEQFAWKTTWNRTQVSERYMGAQMQRQALEGVMRYVVRRLREAGQLRPSTRVEDLVHCTGAHLNPARFPDVPALSLVLQYWRRPAAIPYMSALVEACNKQLPTELIVNVDAPDDATAWADLAWSSEGRVVPILSANVHEARGINRMAGMARGRVLVVLQDDDTLQPADCSWAPPLLRQFDSMPKLGMVGLKGYRRGATAGNKERWSDTFRFFADPATGAHFTFPFHTDYAPLAFRRSALRRVGGVDEGMSDAGECGIVSDWELSVRMWAAGWHVGFMPLLDRGRVDSSTEGSTHRPESARRCWGRQLDLGRHTYDTRWGQGFGAGPGPFLEALENEIRILNLKTLIRNYTDCPFRKGCEDLVGNPPLPTNMAAEFMRAANPMVAA